MLSINGKRNKRENDKPIPYVLRLASIQWLKQLKEERETNSLRIKACFQSLAKGTSRKLTVRNGNTRRGLNRVVDKNLYLKILAKQLSQVQDLECESNLVRNKSSLAY